MENGKIFLIILCVCICVGIIIAVLRKFKVPKIGAMCLVSGGVKTGKSTFSVYLAKKNYKQVYRQWKIRSYFQTAFNLKVDEEPLLYSNIPLEGLPYVPITKELLLREKRFRYHSIIYISEASLVADSQMCRDMTLNERLTYFNKLIGHETRGGCIIYDTQAIGDCHYSIKRCLSEYFYIHHLVKWIPFFMVAYVRECIYSDDNSSINTFGDDVEENLKKVLIPKSTWKHFDSYCYSGLTDSLPVESKVIKLSKKDSLKQNNIVSFKTTNLFKGGKLNEDTKTSDKNVK